jgi:hypothetical protein
MHRVHHPGPTRPPVRPGPAPAADPRRAWLLSLGNQGVQRVLARAGCPDPELQVFYDGFLKRQGLTFAEVFPG